MKRQQELFEHKIAAQKDVDQAASDYESAKSDLDNATKRLLVYGFNPETDQFGQPLQVFSPLAGQVVDMASGRGEFRNDVSASLMTVADLSTVWLTANVPEKDLRYPVPRARASRPPWPPIRAKSSPARCCSLAT